MFDKIAQWLYKIFGPEQEVNDDVTVDETIINYQMYQEELRKRLEKYIKTTCSDIKTAARTGKKCINLNGIPDEFDSSDFLQEIRKHFEERGFTVVMFYENDCFMDTRIKISWM